MKTYTLWSDPGHAWLEVTLDELKMLGIVDRISYFSYIDKVKNNVYLEEDCDLGVFVEKYEKVFGVSPAVREEYREDIFIRELDMFERGIYARKCNYN